MKTLREWLYKDNVPQPHPANRSAMLTSMRWMFFLAPVCGHPHGFESMKNMKNDQKYREATASMMSEPTWTNSCGTCKHRQTALQWWPYGGYQN